MACSRASRAVVDELAASPADLADQDRPGGVGAEAVLEDPEVDPDDVAVLEHSFLRGMPWTTTSLIEVQSTAGYGRT